MYQASSGFLKVNELSSVRRPRAGTMPSFIHTELNNTRNNAALLLNTIESGRHRSGSLNLPMVDSSSFWTHDGPLSPSTEQLLQNDNDFSIARTMRSLGLEDDQQKEDLHHHHHNSLFHHQSPPEFHMPSRSLLSGSNRNRSYSVNATAIYENETTNGLTANTTRISNTPTYASPLEGFTRQQNRPRASSMGRVDASRLPPPQISLWNNQMQQQQQQQQQRSSPLVTMREEEALSLGDSELLANIIHEPTTEVKKYIKIYLYTF